MDASVEIVKHLLASVAHIHAEIPSAHPSTRHLGDERMGTGTIVDPAGLILTVNYVVMGAETVHVTLGRGRVLRAEIVAQDFEIGLALLRVKRQGLPAARIADSESLERGAPVFAIGSTGPRERRVAGGLVTYLGEFEAYWEYMLERGIVSSAANPGFGGGPLFTLGGTMVGVVSLNLNEIARCSLAIPSECYRRNREEFVRFGRVVSRPQRAWLGVFAHVLDEGVVVLGVVPNGPGARSGIQEGDVIVSLDAREVPTRKELYLSLWQHAPGEKMTVEVMRDNEVRRLSVTAGDRADFYKQIS
ncbi:MAG TPA: S1C family serine protease [Methylomirabilota bacterium]|nr:S1C family serine protease [Methylomirabilota bacterium]